jgi:hypothetical protein
MTTLDAAALDTPLTVTRLTPAPGAPLDWLPVLDALAAAVKERRSKAANYTGK